MKRKERYNLIVLCLLLIQLTLSSKSQSSLCQSIFASIKDNNQASLDSYVKQLQTSNSQACVLELFPRYYWGQNMTHILVKFQFLNSADTSACHRVLSVDKSVQHNKFSLSLICTQSTFILRYRIAVTTLMPLNFYHAVWKQADQNTIILQCLKSPSPYFWKTLYLPSQAPLRKPKIWWKIVQKYIENLKKFINDLQLEEEQIEISNQVRKKKRMRQTKLSLEHQPFSSKYFYCNHNNPFQLGSWVI